MKASEKIKLSETQDNISEKLTKVTSFWKMTFERKKQHVYAKSY